MYWETLSLGWDELDPISDMCDKQQSAKQGVE